jgi:signal transduction histidine kinase
VLEVGRVLASRDWRNRGAVAVAIQRVRRPAVWLVVVAAMCSAMAVALTSRHVTHPGAVAAAEAETILGLSVAAACWLRRRPSGSLGGCLALYAAATAITSMEASDDNVLYAAGVVGRASLLPVGAYCLLTFPSGQLHGWVRRALMGFAISVVALISVPMALLSPSVESGQPLGACTTMCPENALRIASVSPDVVDMLRWSGGAAAVVTAIGIAVVLVRRFAAATPPKRRAIGGVVMVGALMAPVVAARWLAVEAGASTELLDGLNWANVILLGLLPIVFVMPLVRAQIVAGSALADMLTKLARRPDSRRWERDVGAALGDPALRLAFWSAPDQGYLGTDGAAIGAAGDEFEWHRIDRAGSPVAAILHDPDLEAGPDLLRAAATATLLSLEGQRLTGEIRAARLRILAAAEEERRRLERDLHDGAQQHLIALRVKVGLMDPVDSAESKRVVAELAGDVDVALTEMRRFGQGVYPPLLHAEGLVGALHGAARRSSIPASIHTTGLGRYDAQIESAIYFCCLEALQNAGKHSGADAVATIRVSTADGSLRFRVEDTGAGFDTRTPGTGVGIANMVERMAAVGGHLRIVSQPGHGTVVSGWVPLGQM